MTTIVTIIDFGLIFDYAFAEPNISLILGFFNNGIPPIEAHEHHNGYHGFKHPPTDVIYSEQKCPENSMFISLSR